MSEASSQGLRRSPDVGVWLEQYGDYLFNYALFRLRDASAAEDVVQETFLAALRAYERFEGRGSERTWLIGILKHKITDHFRRLARETRIATEEDGPEHAEFFAREDRWKNHWNGDYAPNEWHATPDQIVERQDFWDAITKCLSPLPQRMASAFTLREVDGLRGEEICELLGITLNNLWVLLHRARLHLRHCLEKSWFKNDAYER